MSESVVLNNGRILIPKSLRERYNLGKTIILKETPQGLLITTKERLLEDAVAFTKKQNKDLGIAIGSTQISDELIAERRLEAALEHP